MSKSKDWLAQGQLWVMSKSKDWLAQDQFNE